jgi:hypothetical protein
MMKAHRLVVLLWLCCMPPALQAASISFNPAKDNTIYSEFPTRSNGAGMFFYAGRNANGNLRRALLAFDLSSVPNGVRVTSVELILSMNRSISGPFDFSLHRLLEDWGEGASDAGDPGGTGASAQTGDATWTLAFFPGTAWSTAGGSFASTPSATTSVSGIASYSWSSAQMVADVQGWLDTPGANFGWLLQGGESAVSAKRFDSGESPVASQRPQLVVTFDAVPEPSAASLLFITAALSLFRKNTLRHSPL